MSVLTVSLGICLLLQPVCLTGCSAADNAPAAHSTYSDPPSLPAHEADLTVHDWFADHATDAVRLCLMEETPENEFRPRDYLTRAEAAFACYQLAKLYADPSTEEWDGFEYISPEFDASVGNESPWTDLAPYQDRYEIFNWGSEHHVFDSTFSSKFDPFGTITAEEFYQWICRTADTVESRYLAKPLEREKDYTGNVDELLAKINETNADADVDNSTDWVQRFAEAGIIRPSDQDDSLFSIDQPILRSAASVVLERSAAFL